MSLLLTKPCPISELIFFLSYNLSTHMQKNRKKERKQNLTPSGASIVCNCLIFQQSDKHPLPFVDKGRRNMDIMTYFSIVLFFAPSPPPTPKANGSFQSQGLNLSHSYDPRHRCYTAGSLTHCARSGIEPEKPQRQHRFLNPLCLTGNSNCSFPCCLLMTNVFELN